MGKYRNEIVFEDAEREQLFAKVAIMGASGSGKTVGSLKLAHGLVDGDWSKIFVADTENKRALAYRGTTHTGLEIGKFKHASIHAPYDTEKFIDIIDVAMENGAEVLIIDSISHQWEGLGGVLEENEQQGSDFWAWKGPKKKHHKLKDHIQQTPLHIIVTMRTKQEYAVIPGGGRNGKNAIEKLGMKPVQENAFDYEFLLSFHINEDSEANATKDNTGLFRGEEFVIEPEHGSKLRTWLVEGKEVKTVKEEKNEAEEKRQALINKFTEQRKATDKAQKFFTNQEIKTNTKLPQWTLEMLEALDKQLTEAAAKKKQQQKPKQDEQKAPEEPKQEENLPSTNRGDMIQQIYKLSETPEVAKTVQEVMEKWKVENFDSLRDEQVKFILDLAITKNKFAQKEQKGA